MWGYYWGYTMAQIELLTNDAPIIVYAREKKNKNKKQSNPKRSDIENAAKKWYDKYANNNEKININLSDFNRWEN